MSATRFTPVGISVEQLAVAWARREGAAAGSTIVVGHEISGRMRLGIPWQPTPGTALACATVLRPALLPDVEDVLWVVALVAAAQATGARPGWPDLLFNEDGRQIGAVNLDVQLGPGRIESAVVSLRVDVPGLVASADGRVQPRESIVEAFVEHALRTSSLAEHGVSAILDEYAVCSALIGQIVRARLLPKGDTRGRAVAVDPQGRLVLESPSGMLERLMPATVLRVDRV